MAPKGKKLWRRKIDTEEIDKALEKETAAQRKAAKIHQVPDSELFYVDTAQDDAVAENLSKGGPVRRGTLRDKTKLLKCQTILNAAHAANPVHRSSTKAKKLKGVAFKKKAIQQKSLVSREVINATDTSQKLNFWESDSSLCPELAIDASALPERPQMPPVEIDAPGCSFNPDADQHQDSVAEAVAAEMSKIYAKELRPHPPRLLNHMPDLGELHALLDTGGDDESDSNEESCRQDKVEEPAVGSLAKKLQGKKTQTDRNRQKRRREAELAVQERKVLKNQRRELDRVKEIVQELGTEEKIQVAQAARRAVTQAEKALSEPPKLGKHKFEAPSVQSWERTVCKTFRGLTSVARNWRMTGEEGKHQQVLLSEEIDGSLRRLKGTPMLAKHRFKHLQKRGMIEPRVRIEKPQRRKAIVYQTGDRLERAITGNEEIKGLANKNARVQGSRPSKPKNKKRR